MDKSDKIIFWTGLFLTLETAPTWFIFGWYWFDLSVASIIATLVLVISFLAKEWFLECFYVFIYYIKLTNIISLYAAYGKSEYLPLLNASKPILNIILYVWFLYIFTKFIKGWNYKDQNEDSTEP